MLNNQDFAKLLAQPEKLRFDIKQIDAWDKQNAAQLKKKSTTKSSTTHTNIDETNIKSDLYRDRAEERRKNVPLEDDLNLEKIAASLNAAETKFLGGDEAHTHLVRGLDYALLRKNREKLPSSAVSSSSTSSHIKASHREEVHISQPSSSSSSYSTAEQVKERELKPIAIHSQLAASIQQSLMNSSYNIPINSESQHSNSIKITVPVSTLLASQGYELNLLDADSYADIPTTINRSKYVSITLYIHTI